MLANQVEEETPTTFLETLWSYPNQEMWEHMYVDGDGEWIEDVLVEGTLDISHDGSYQPEVSKEVCSTAVWMRCRRTKKTLFLSFAEHSPHVSSHRSEILGEISAQLVLKAAARNRHLQYPNVSIYCDNKEVLNHGSEAEKNSKKNRYSLMYYM